MVRRLYLMRHGYTLFNLLNKKQGWSDSPLVDLGVKQAHEVREHLVAKGINFDHVYSSPSGRAIETLGIVLGEKISFTCDARLREWCFGAFEGQDNCLSPRPIKGDFFVPFGGESEREVQNRMVTALSEIMARDNHSKVFVVSHGAAMRLFYEYWQHTSLIISSGLVANCGMFTFVYDESTHSFSCTESYSPALGPEALSPLPRVLFPELDRKRG